MALIWNEAMSTGIAEVDEHHKTLILWVNKLSDAMKAGKGNEEALRILDFLGGYATMHFSCEEDCMTRYNCPTAAANKKAHEAFLTLFTGMRADVVKNGVTTEKLIALHTALGDWLKNHIMKVDAALLACVK